MQKQRQLGDISDEKGIHTEQVGMVFQKCHGIELMTGAFTSVWYGLMEAKTTIEYLCTTGSKVVSLCVWGFNSFVKINTEVPLCRLRGG